MKNPTTPLSTTAYTLGRGHTCPKCEHSNIPCIKVGTPEGIGGEAAHEKLGEMPPVSEFMEMRQERDLAIKAVKAYMFVEQSDAGRNPHLEGTNKHRAFEFGMAVLRMPCAEHVKLHVQAASQSLTHDHYSLTKERSDRTFEIVCECGWKHINTSEYSCRVAWVNHSAKNPTPEPLGEPMEALPEVAKKYAAKTGATLIPRLVDHNKGVVMYTNSATNDLHEVSGELWATLVVAKSEEGESAADAWERGFIAGAVFEGGGSTEGYEDLDLIPPYVAPKKPSTEEEVGG